MLQLIKQGMAKDAENTANAKPTKKEVDAAFDVLAKFLFDMYRKQKEASETETSNGQN